MTTYSINDDYCKFNFIYSIDANYSQSDSFRRAGTFNLMIKTYCKANKFLDDNQIRVYGFHGSSHKFVSEKAVAYLKKEKSKIRCSSCYSL